MPENFPRRLFADDGDLLYLRRQSGLFFINNFINKKGG